MLYIHIPFCKRKCAYCAFYSIASNEKIDSYITALVKEIESRAKEQQTPLKTIYIGGGTPSLLAPHRLEKVVCAIERNFDTSQLVECTIECNPEDLTLDYTKWLHDTGLFNRISIGVQSFDDNSLKSMNRRHTGQQAICAIENAYNTGFTNISIDLIYGLPKMTDTQWDNTLQKALSLPVSHLSAYSLTIEDGTIFSVLVKQGRLTLPAEEHVLRQYDTLVEQCKGHGFGQYEISNFAKKGRESLHNSSYWNHTPYIGIGAAAHSFNGKTRRWNVANVDAYISTASFEEEVLSDVYICNETIMLGLRTTKGIVINDIPQRWRDKIIEKAKRFVENGLLECTECYIKPSRKGLLQADGMARDLFVS